ncbi:autotransporter outer membrane beta-barrel domain-containing protein [Thorsellia anophelis]|uniref:Outer membrane autotransporter barrel domain-containing protein n=1 Tax=Thorsellia anophelis DSM 18579 TaxID=1123402 RepID=A0A1H9ZXS2_9GAMM|nr:autotransporter outer membrane beta-barrel domain-containing protein [Thorsellia anophelis]SES86192.1 outer membrane autotransporter barrel domain-containing protein [Thorsellia anophelis DSM 18579]
MNKVYRIVFNKSLGIFQAVSELAQSKGKSSSSLVDKSASITQLIQMPFRLSLLRLLTLTALGMGINFGLFTEAQAAECGPTTRTYTYCFVGENDTGIGNWGTFGNWVNAAGEQVVIKTGIATDFYLLSGTDKTLILDKPIINPSNNQRGNPLGTLVIEKGARLRHAMEGSGTGHIFAGNILVEGEENALSTIELNTLINGSLRQNLKTITLGNYSQITVSDTVGSSSDSHQKVLGDEQGVKLAGQNIYFNALNNDSLIFRSGHFKFNQFTTANDNTIIDGKATRVMNINKGDANALNSDGKSGNGTVSITDDNYAYIGQWNIYGGTLKISGSNSLGYLTPGQRGSVVFDIDASLGDSYGLNYAGKNLGILEFSVANSVANSTGTHDFVTKNTNTLLKFDSYTNGSDRKYILSGDISGKGGIYYGSGGGREGVETIYELGGELSYEGDTYLDIKTKLDFKSNDGIRNLKGDFLVAVDSTIQFSGDNSFYGDIYYDFNNMTSEDLRKPENGFDYKKMAAIRFGDRQDSETIVRSNVNMYGYTDKDIILDVLNSTLTLNSGYAGNNSKLPFDISMLDDQGIRGSYDGVYGAKLLDIYGDGNKKYVSSQANFVLSEFDLKNPDDMWQIEMLGLDINSTVEEWQAAINQLAKDNPNGMGTGSTVVLNQNSIIGAPGINDPLEDEVIFNGQFEPTTKDKSLGGLTGTLTGNQAYGVNSTLIKTGDGRTVLINPNLTLSDIGEPELLQQQLNVNVKAGTLDWRVDEKYNPLVDSYNPNVMVVQGNYQTQAGATTAISNAATFLRIQKQYIDFTTVEHPEGIYIPGSGDFILAGKDNPGTDYDPSLDGDRATLNIIAGGGERPEIYAEGKVDIRGALLSVTGVASTQDPETILKSSEIEDTQFTLIHTSDGFIGGDFVADEDDTQDNLKAVFANNNRPAAFVDYLTGGEGRIINCNVNVTTNCLIDADSDLEEVGVKDTSVNAQEYVLSSLSLSWDYKGDLPSITGDFTIEPRSESFEVDTVLADRAADDIKRNEDGLFESDYGLWDGKTLTKKGQGLLVLSADNTYTGDTNINAGRLRITRDQNLGALGVGSLNLGNGLTSFGSILEIAGTEFDSQGSSSRELVLGRSDNNTINVIEEDNTATFKGNITNSVRFDTAKWYLPNGTLVANQSAPPPEAKRALWADVDGNLVDQNAPPSGSILRFERNSGLMKTGKGHLVLAPDATDSDPSNHKVMDYDGDTEVIEGTLTFKGDTSELKGDLYNQGKAIFDQDTDSSFAGNITEKKFRAVADDPIIAANYAFVPTLFKTGTGALTLKGTSDRNWLVEEGGLITEASRFTGDIKLNADTFLTFDQSPNSLTRASNATEYSGIILGDASSTLNVVGNGALRFDSNTESTLGNVVIGDGTSQTTFYIGNNDPASEKALEVQTDFTIKSNATTELENTNSYLNVGGTFTQEADSVLNVMLNLDNNSRGKADITANDISLAGSINVLGFQRVNGCEEAVNSESCDENVASRFARATELDDVNYTLMQSDNKINIAGLQANQGGFKDPSRTHPLDSKLPSYLVYFYSASEVANEDGKFTFDIDNINLAWNYGDVERANGTFNIVGDTGFEIDVVLKDRSTENFNSWDGKTLIKTGAGELVLSEQNEYSGETLIYEGTLTISDDGNLGQILGPFNPGVVLGEEYENDSKTAKLKIATNNDSADKIELNREITILGTNKTIEVSEKEDEVVLAYYITAENGFTKSGEGTLTVDGQINIGPNPGSILETDVSEVTIEDGTLRFNFKNDAEYLNSHIFNAGRLIFDVDANLNQAADTQVILKGDVLGLENADGSFSNGTVDKLGAGDLSLSGNTALDWHVQGGGLITSADSFLGDIKLDANTNLNFITKESKVSEYSGLLNGASSSTLNVVGGGKLDFNYNNGSTVGNVNVGSGTDESIFEISSNNTEIDKPDTFIVEGDFTTKTGSTTNLVGENTYLEVKGKFTQETGSALGVTLDLNNNNVNVADIIADEAVLGGELTLLGFARVLCEESVDDTDCKDGLRFVKATDLAGIKYKLISANTITGEFDADVSQTHYLTPKRGGFLVFNDGLETGDDGQQIYVIDKPELAWIEGGNDRSTGTFFLGSGNSFNVDKILEDRTDFTNGGTEFVILDQDGNPILDEKGQQITWDGKTLTKSGEGILELSENNTYTGDTYIDEGTLVISQDQNLGNKDTDFGDVGDIHLGSKDPTNGGQSTLEIKGQGPFETDRNLFLGNRDDNTIDVVDINNSAEFNGEISGDGGLVKDGDGELILTNVSNSYQGKTEIIDGTLTLGLEDDLIDDSAEVIIQDNATLKIADGTDQTLNNLQGSDPDKLHTEPPAIVIESSDGKLSLVNNKDTEYNGSIKGSIDLVIKGTLDPDNSGELTLSGNLTEFEGDTQITHNGTLIIDGSNNTETDTKNGNIITNIVGDGDDSNTKLKLVSGGTITGTIRDLGEVNIKGPNAPGNHPNWQITDDSNIGKLILSENGTAGFIDPSDPNWDGRDLEIDELVNDGTGTIVLYTKLGNDDSITDKITLTNSSKPPQGTTILEIRNKNGKGDLTTKDGIKVVDADTNAVETGDDAFKLKGGRVVVDNLYNYYLEHGKLDGTGEDWFLRSDKNEGLRDEIDIARNFNAITGQLGLLTLGTYHDRVGANTSTMYHKELQPHTPWIRLLGESGDVKNGQGVDNQLKNGADYDYDIKGLQVGFDFYEKTDEDNIRNLAGAYLSYANSKNDVKGALQNKIGTSSLDSISGGLYYTRTNEKQAYLDVVGQYSRYTGLDGKSRFGQRVSSGGYGLLLSGEVGYPWHIDENWKLEPQAQLIYQHIKLDASQDEFSRFTPDADNSFTGRLGARLAHHDLTDEGRPVDSFVRFNYWKTFDYDSKMIVSDLDGQNPMSIETNQGGSKVQFGVGVAYEPEIDWQLFLGVDYNRQIDGASGDSISGHLGVKYAF